MRSAAQRLPVLSFVAVSLLAGGNAVGIRFSNRELDPLWGAAVRFGAAAVVLLAIMAALRLRLPRGRALAGAVVFGVLNFGVTFALAYYALVRIHAGLAQTILALVPLAALLLAVLQGQEKFRVSAAVGVLFAIVGVAVATQASPHGTIPWLSLLAILGSVLSFAQAAVLVRRLPKVHPVTMNAVGMTAAAAVLFLGSLIAGDRWVLPHDGVTWWALGYLIVAGSVLNFVFYLLLIRDWGASRAAYVFVTIPVVTIVLSAWLDAEPLTAGLLLGTPLILLGVYFGALRDPQRIARTPGSSQVE